MTRRSQKKSSFHLPGKAPNKKFSPDPGSLFHILKKLYIYSVFLARLGSSEAPNIKFLSPPGAFSHLGELLRPRDRLRANGPKWTFRKNFDRRHASGIPAR